jgi:hypothetical protein
LLQRGNELSLHLREIGPAAGGSVGQDGLFKIVRYVQILPEQFIYVGQLLGRRPEIIALRTARPRGVPRNQCWGSGSGCFWVIRIRMFLGLPDPDPLLRGMDPDQAPDPSLFS